jgi:hypothetical protein
MASHRSSWLFPTLACILSSCAATRVPGPSQVRPGWDGRFGEKRVGVYLVMGRGPYTIAEFESMSQADAALRRLDPEIHWASVDSGNRAVRNLGGWDLDSLGDLLRADPAVWSGAHSGMEPVLRSGEPSLLPATKAALVRVGKAMGLDLLIALRPGGSRNAKDSLDRFEDPAWFGVFDLSDGAQLYSLEVPIRGSRSAARSAETDWAARIWSSFEDGIRQIRHRPVPKGS